MFEKENLSFRAIDAYRFRFENNSATVSARDFCAISLRLTVQDHTKIIVGETEYRLHGGDLCMFPPGIKYTRISKDEDLVAIHFYAEGVSFSQPQIVRSVSPKVTDLFLQAYTAAEQKKKGYRYTLQSILYGIFAELAAPKMHRITADAVACIQKNYCSPDFSIAAVCREQNISPGYLRKLFHRDFGISPKQYCDNLRFARARALLETEYLSVGEVAKMVGWNDRKNFSTAFKKRFGFSPGQTHVNRK